MQRSLSLWQLGGLTFTAILGTLFHFLYGWTGNIAFAPFCAVNESTWEHMKILFFPMLIFAVIQSKFFIKSTPNFWLVKLIGILIGLTLIPVLFYTYNGVIGKSPDWINISIFFVSAAVTFITETRLFRKGKPRCIYPKFAFLAICLIGIMFIVFTFFVPNLEIFKNPNS